MRNAPKNNLKVRQKCKMLIRGIALKRIENHDILAQIHLLTCLFYFLPRVIGLIFPFLHQDSHFIFMHYFLLYYSF